METYKEFRFEAAHFLPKTCDGHKCKRMHGHSYKVIIHIMGLVDQETGFVIDFGDIKKIFTPILEELDHSVLNELSGLENPTAENLAIWIWKRLLPSIPGLSKIKIEETNSSGCIYDGN